MILVPDDVAPAEVVAQLRTEGLYCDARGRALRLSPGVVTTPESVEALCGHLKRLLGGPARVAPRLAAGA